jgi:hypothetical protein
MQIVNVEMDVQVVIIIQVVKPEMPKIENIRKKSDKERYAYYSQYDRVEKDADLKV